MDPRPEPASVHCVGARAVLANLDALATVANEPLATEAANARAVLEQALAAGDVDGARRALARGRSVGDVVTTELGR